MRNADRRYEVAVFLRRLGARDFGSGIPLSTTNSRERASRLGARVSSTPSKRKLARANRSSCSVIFPELASAVSSAMRSHGNTLSQ